MMNQDYFTASLYFYCLSSVNKLDITTKKSSQYR